MTYLRGYHNADIVMAETHGSTHSQEDNMEAQTLTQLIAARIAAKRIEDQAVTARRDLDAEIAARLARADKPEGSLSEKVDGYKVTVTYKIDRKVDTEKLTADWAKLPLDIQAIFKWTAALSTTELRKLDGRAAACAARYYEAKQASPSIKIEAV